MGIEGKGNSESNVEMEARDMRREQCRAHFPHTVGIWHRQASK